METKLEHGQFLTVDEVDKLDLPTPPTHISQMNIPYLWELGYTGYGIKVAVIDTGCDINNPLIMNKVKALYNFSSDDDGDGENVTDYLLHGTHVATLIAGESYKNKVMGVAPDVDLYIYKAVSKDGIADYDNIAQAIYASAQSGVDIINISLAGEREAPQIHEAIKFAVNMNCSVVCASGNDGDGKLETTESLYPACYPEVIEVGSINDDNTVSVFSNTNSHIDCITNGENLLSGSVDGGFYVLSGTSQSAPLVSGVLALLKQWGKAEYGRDLLESELYALLLKNAKTLKGVSRLCQGHGMIRVDNLDSAGELNV